MIIAACQDAGIQPGEIDYVECHGTGAKIGDPIEIAAIQNTIAKDCKGACYIGSVKSNMGHLESTAGIAGLIKSIAVLNYGKIPPNLHFNQPNQYIDFESSHIKVAAEETPIDHQAVIGVSSFGFGGTNSHITVKGVEKAVRKPIQPQEVSFNREQTAALAPYLRLEASDDAEPAFAVNPVQGGPDVRSSIQALFHSLTGIEEINPELELVEQGLDSTSATELLHQLEEQFKIEIGPDIIFEYPLRDQMVDELYARSGASLN